MKVLFDSQIFDWQINGGISRYFIEILNRLDGSEEIEPIIKVKHSYNTYIQGTRWLANKPILKNLHFKGKLGALKIVNQEINRPYSNHRLKKGTFDIFHPTYYDPYFLGNLKNKFFVLTVYDLTNEKFNDNSAVTKKVLAWKQQLINAAGHIIAISENTKKDIVEYYKINPDKVTTIHQAGGFDDETRQTAKESIPANQPANYILFVGSRGAYKNFLAFVREAAPVLNKENISLIVAGGGPMSAGETELLKKLDISNRVIAYPHVSDALLAGLYSNALTFVFPSLYEGFGLPVLESMQCECPALLSNNSSLPEVGGSAAVYFDPFREGSLHDELIKLLSDSNGRAAMVAAGKNQVKKFSWDITSEKHISVYKNMVP